MALLPYLDVADFNNELQPFLDALSAKRGTGILRVGEYTLTQTLTVQNTRNLRLIGMAPSGETDGVIFRWNGPDNGTALYLNGVRDSVFEGFSVLNGTGKVGTSIQVDRTDTVQVETTYDVFRHLHLTGSQAGLRWTGQNGNDLHTLDHVKVNGTGTAGLSFENPETKGVHLVNTELANRQFGIHVATNGVGLTMQAGGFDACSVNLQVNGSGDPLSIIGAQCENSLQLLAGGGAGIVEFIGCRMDTNNSSVAEWVTFDGGVLRLVANDFCSGMHRPNVKFTVTNGWLVSGGNIYPNATPWTNPPTSSIGDVYQSGNGLRPISTGNVPPALPSEHVGCLLALPFLAGRVLLKA